MDYAVWNTLHDGSIESVGGSIPGDVGVCVRIPYLCEKLPTAAGHVIVRLGDCREFRYRPFGQDPVSDLSAIAVAGIQILSAEQVGGAVSVECVGGVLTLVYDRATIALAEGRVISQAELEAAAERYWREGEEKARRATTDTGHH